MTHNRVTPQGRAMGRNAARLADLGRLRLESAGLANINNARLRSDMCKTCACKLSSVPNGCLQTQLDFLKSAIDGKPFMCHSPSNGKICAGWMGARAEIVANPLPKEVVDLVSKWEYSPADDAAEIGAKPC